MQVSVHLGKSCIFELYPQAPDKITGEEDSANPAENFYFLMRSEKQTNQQTKNQIHQ